MNARSLWIPLLATAAVLLTQSAWAQANLTMQSSRTYVMNYTVQNGIAVPVMGVLTNGVNLRAGPAVVTPPPSTVVPLVNDRRALDNFFAEAGASGWGKTQAAAPATAPATPAATSASSTSGAAPSAGSAVPTAAAASSSGPKPLYGKVALKGVLRMGENDDVLLVVTVGGQEVIYNLGANEAATRMVSGGATNTVIGKLTGTVRPGAPYPVMQVESGSFETK